MAVQKEGRRHFLIISGIPDRVVIPPLLASWARGGARRTAIVYSLRIGRLPVAIEQLLLRDCVVG